MKQRPWPLIVLAALHFAAPIGNIALNALLTRQSVFSYFSMAMQPEYLMRNWFIIVCPIVAGLAIYACKKWSFFVYILALTTLFVFSYTGYLSKAGSISIIPVILVYIINIAVVSYFLLPRVREIYFNPRLRWWESLPRYRSDFQCHWNNEGEEKKHDGKIGNFSMNGLFLKSNEFPEDGAGIQVQITVNDESPSFTGQVIHHSHQNAVGFGVKFCHTKETQEAAKKIVEALDQQGMKITRHLTYEDSFSYWLKNLLTTGRGIIPPKEK